MRNWYAAVALASLLCAGACVAAMTSASNAPQQCQVVGGEKLPSAVGGSAGVCSAIARAMARAAPGVSYRVEVSVPRPWILAATVVLGDGRLLPERRLTVSDAPLSRAVAERFAEQLAGDVAAAVRG